jgi:ELWxxDGT repeat protein
MVKDINPGTSDGIVSSSYSFLYTKQGIFFPADDGTNGIELWKSDGTSAGTSMVKNINPGAGNSNPVLNFFLVNGKIFFNATDGTPADESITDLYVIDGVFSVLPVTLLNFTATLQANAVQLNWTTSSEINSGYFVIQRSPDGIHFNDIGQEAASDNSLKEKKYGYNDDGAYQAGSDKLFYRLRIEDLDGKYKYSNVIIVKLKGGLTELKVYPNPVHNQLGILFNTNSAGSVGLVITDINGKRLYHQIINGGISSGLQNIDVSTFENGTYFIQLITNGGDSKTIKFVKE